MAKDKNFNDNMYKNPMDKKQAGLHDGHRERMRDRIRKYGINSLEEHEVLEYVLYHFVPRRDVNGLAHQLINEFGSLYNILSAEVSRLEKVPGISKITALFLSSFVDIYDAAQISRQKEAVYLNNIREMIDFSAPRIANADYEKLLVILLDINNKVIGEKMFTNKYNKGVTIKRQQIVTAATDVHADKMIIAHNHPGGSFSPSEQDIQEASNIKNALSYIGITFVDSLILTKDRASSVGLAKSFGSSYRPFYPIKERGDYYVPFDEDVEDDGSFDKSIIEGIDFGNVFDDYDLMQSEKKNGVNPSQDSSIPEINIDLADKNWLKSLGFDDIF